jgi:DNA-binding MarR family transcriptional regulator
MKREENMTFGRSLSIILRFGQMYLDRQLKHLHVRSGQIPILRLLDLKDNISQESIGNFFHLDKGTVAKAIRPLMNAGYITRKTNPKDKRAYQILLTRKGRDIIPDIQRTLSEWTDMLTADFEDKEKIMVNDFLSRMAKNAVTHLNISKSEK